MILFYTFHRDMTFSLILAKQSIMKITACKSAAASFITMEVPFATVVLQSLEQ